MLDYISSHLLRELISTSLSNWSLLPDPLRWLNFNHLSGSANLLTCFLMVKTRVGSWSWCQQLHVPLQRSDKPQSPRPTAIAFSNTMATCDADPHAACPRAPDMHALPDEGITDEVLPVLKNDHVERVMQLRDKICAREADPERYELCVQMRDELFRKSSEVQLLAAACDHVMSSHCAEYKDWKLDLYTDIPPWKGENTLAYMEGLERDRRENKGEERCCRTTQRWFFMILSVHQGSRPFHVPPRLCFKLLLPCAFSL